MKKIILFFILTTSINISAKTLQKNQLSCESGQPKGCFDLGTMYYAGEGVKQDKAQAFKYLSKAAKAGYADAQYNLGFMYHTGSGVKQGIEQVIKWMTKAAKQNKVTGTTNYQLPITNRS